METEKVMKPRLILAGDFEFGEKILEIVAPVTGSYFMRKRDIYDL